MPDALPGLLGVEGGIMFGVVALPTGPGSRGMCLDSGLPGVGLGTHVAGHASSSIIDLQRNCFWQLRLLLGECRRDQFGIHCLALSDIHRMATRCKYPSLLFHAT